MWALPSIPPAETLCTTGDGRCQCNGEKIVKHDIFLLCRQGTTSLRCKHWRAPWMSPLLAWTTWTAASASLPTPGQAWLTSTLMLRSLCKRLSTPSLYPTLNVMLQDNLSSERIERGLAAMSSTSSRKAAQSTVASYLHTQWWGPRDAIGVTTKAQKNHNPRLCQKQRCCGVGTSQSASMGLTWTWTPQT